jgi:hypothetical protein
MGIADLTRQLAKEAITSQVDELIDPRGKPETPAPAPSADSIAAAMVAQVQAMQNALKDDQELIVSCTAGSETIRVFEIFTPSPRLLVLTGADPNRTLTRIVAPAETIQLVCKPAAVPDGAKPARLRFVFPKPKNP